MNIYSFLAAVFALIGQVAIMYKKPWSFYFWILSNFIWMYVSIFVNFDISLFVMNVVFVTLNIATILKWRK